MEQREVVSDRPRMTGPPTLGVLSDRERRHLVEIQRAIDTFFLGRIPLERISIDLSKDFSNEIFHVNVLLIESPGLWEGPVEVLRKWRRRWRMVVVLCPLYQITIYQKDDLRIIANASSLSRMNVYFLDVVFSPVLRENDISGFDWNRLDPPFITHMLRSLWLDTDMKINECVSDRTDPVFTQTIKRIKRCMERYERMGMERVE